MKVVRFRAGTRLTAVLAAGFALFLGPLSVRAEDGRWVTKDGRKFGLTRSNKELAIKLRQIEDEDAYARRLAESGLGKLVRFKRAPQAAYKIVETSKTDRMQRERLLRDPSVVEVQSIYRFEGVDGPVVGTGFIVVKVERGLADKEIRGLWKDYGIVEASPVKGQPRVYKVGVTLEQDELQTAEALADDERTAWAQPDFRRERVAAQIAPADEFFDLQWHLNNTGQFNSTAGVDIDALAAWSISTGEDVLFGMFDDCVDVDHEDLRENYIGIGQDVVLSPSAPGYDDPRPKLSAVSQFTENRHGTAVMGLAVARANNKGGRGVAYNAKFTASRGLNDLASDSQTASAYIFARDQGVDVHNNSWGPGFRYPDPEIIVDAIEVAFATGRNKGDINGDGIDDPLGMVIFFASGNDDQENEAGFTIVALPQVITTGASNSDDLRSLYSNFGESTSILAPSGDEELLRPGYPGVVTTDNTDTSEVDKGYNQDPDTGSYTFFSGTSGACPIAAGVAGLILSVNPNLTATDVRMLIEHTADRIEPNVADYDSVTSHSLTHGYGRINAGGTGTKLGAVEAAQETLSNGGHTWPDRPADLVVDTSSIRWKQNPGTVEFLVVQSDDPFAFIPVDGECYDPAQTNCSAFGSLPGNLTTLAVGCGLSCTPGGGVCGTGAEQCVNLPAASKSMAVYARNAIGRYSWGVAFDSAGNVRGSGTFIDLAGAGEVVIPPTPPASRPEVTINVSPLAGDSPLTVNFMGNAVSSVPIDESRTTWDFDIDSPPEVDATSRAASHVYEAGQGETRVFVARLTMYDENGVPGSEEVAITVEGPPDQGDPGGGGSISIVVGSPNNPDSNVATGKSPFSVLLSLDATGVTGTLQGIIWDLGDGTTSTGLSVPHTYVNEGTTNLRIPVTATATFLSGTATFNMTATRIITVEPGTGIVDPGDVGDCELPGTCADGPGGAARICGSGLGMVPLFLFATLAWMRRRTR